MLESLSKSTFAGKGGLQWWIGQVAPYESWGGQVLRLDPEAGAKSDRKDIDVIYNRCKVRVVGYHENVEDENLPWAHVLTSPALAAGYHGLDKDHMLKGGESVIGFWLDGDDAQHPCVLGVFYRNKYAPTEPTTPENKLVSQPASSYLGANDILRQRRGSETSASRVASASGLNSTEESSTENGSTNPATKEKKKPTRFDKVNYASFYDPITGTITTKPKTPSHKIEEETGSGLTQGVKAFHDGTQVSTSRPPCTVDNSIAAITGELGEFMEFLITVEQYANFYIGGVAGAISDLNSNIKSFAKSIASVMQLVINKVRDYIFGLVGEKISTFINSLLPENLKPIFGESIKATLDTLYCIFQKILGQLLNLIFDLLGSLIGNMVNAPLCAAEQFAGTIMSAVQGFLEEQVSPILESLSNTLGGALGSINSILGKAFEIIGRIFDFIGCDKFKCPLPSRFDTKYGPSQAAKDNFNKVLGRFSNPYVGIGEEARLSDITQRLNDGDVTIFGTRLGDIGNDADPALAARIAQLTGGCPSDILRCGPPKVTIFGGGGFGALANVVVNRIGSVIGFDILSPGEGYVEPPFVRIEDRCNNGQGASAYSIIEDGRVVAIVVGYPGFGYLNNDSYALTPAGIIDGISDNSESSDKLAVVDRIIVINPGTAYNPGDSTNFGDLTVVDGRILEARVSDGGTGFDDLPDIQINTDTGFGAVLQPVLRFVEPGEVKDYDPGKVITIVDCVGRIQ